MIGCDLCDDWFHFQCIGLTQMQAERAEKYVCVRCSLRTSFCQTAVQAAQITNRWTNSEEFAKAREAKRAKVHSLTTHALKLKCHYHCSAFRFTMSQIFHMDNLSFLLSACLVSVALPPTCKWLQTLLSVISINLSLD
jgi:hypothetical protein